MQRTLMAAALGLALTSVGALGDGVEDAQSRPGG